MQPVPAHIHHLAWRWEALRVVGFGARSVYVVSFDAYDLAYLERYALPTL